MKELQAGKSPSRMIKETVVGTTTTDANGAYSFCDSHPATTQSSKRQKTAGAAVGATSLPVTLECDDSSDNDFTNTPLLCIEGTTSTTALMKELQAGKSPSRMIKGCGRHYDDRCKRRLLVLRLSTRRLHSLRRGKRRLGAGRWSDLTPGDPANAMTRVTTTSRTHPSCASRAPSSTTALMKELQAGKSPSRMIKDVVGTTTTDANGAYSFCD